MKHKATGREIAREIEIAASGETFSIVRAYEREAEALGFNMGSMCGSDPRGLSREYVCIAKWRNLGGGDYLELDGVVECRDNRNGKTARILIFK